MGMCGDSSETPDSQGREPRPRDEDDKGAMADDLRRKIRKLKRATTGRSDPRSPAKAAGVPREIVYRRDLPHTPRGRRGQVRPLGPHIELAEAVSGVEVVAPHGGQAYIVETLVGELQGCRQGLCGSFASAVSDEASPLRRRLCGVYDGPMLRPEDVIFLDLETTGLGVGPLFLIGTMVWEGGGLVVRQYFARNYAEERAILSLFLDTAAEKSLLVSFNGKSFDFPYTRLRAAVSGIPFEFSPAHLDLLHVSRRIWGGKLPDCRLQTLERQVCGRMRDDDIPGHLIPEAYHAYVRTGNAGQMASCVRHNMLDLVTLADLATRLPPL